jgi:3-deoxy-D-manno-octulosonic-acid transferase
MTTGTVTAAEIAATRLPAGAIHQFVPIDTPSAVRSFLDHWRPNLALFAESELWPNMLRALRRRSLPLAIISARMSERSFRAWRAFTPLARAVLGRADLFLAQTAADAERLRALGAKRVLVCGNLKFDAPPPEADPALLAEMRRQIGDRPVLLAASTHPGEEEAIAAAHKDLVQTGIRPLTIVAPRHPQRGDEIAARLAEAGLSFGRRARGDNFGEADIYLADTIGEMGMWYRLADVVFLGGSMVPHGGQNPIEPAKLLVPILHGRHIGNFREVYDALAAAQATMTVHDSTTLARAAKLLIEDRSERDRLVQDALACVGRFTGALDRTLDALEPYLKPLCGRP